MNRKIFFLSVSFGLALGRPSWAQDHQDHGAKSHDIPGGKPETSVPAGRQNTPHGQDSGADPWESSELHKALNDLPENGGKKLDNVYHSHTYLYRDHPEVRGQLLQIMKGVVSLHEVNQDIDRDMDRAKKEGGEDAILKENLRRRESLRKWIDKVMIIIAKNPTPEIKNLHDDPKKGLMSVDLGPVYDALHFKMNADRWVNQAPSASAYDYRAQQRLDHGDADGAYHDADRAHQLDPRDGRALALRAAALYQMGDFAGARRDAQSALQIESNDPIALSIAKLTENQIPSMNPQTLSSELPQPQAPDVVGGFGGSGHPIAMSPQQSGHYAEDAAHFLRLGDFSAAVAWAGRALDANDKNARAYDLRAMGYMGLGQHDIAVRDARSALGLLPSDRLALDVLAKALNRLHEYGEAKAAAEKALALNPRDAQAWYNLAYAEAGEGHRDAMLAALKKAAEFDPGHFESRYETALEAPLPQDLTLLFADPGASKMPARSQAGNSSDDDRNRLFLLIVVSSVIGGVLIALGFYHVLLAPRRRTRRVKPPQAPGLRDAVVSNGSVINGSFKILRQIGYGGMGKVYEAMDLHLQRTVAVKLMREEIQADPRERERFLKEARMVAALHHPNIVEIYSIIEDGANLYLVFELVQGKTLADLLQERDLLRFEEVLAIMKGVCAALEYAHGRGIIHRDLKPSNIMMTGQDGVKVMDFGVARQAREALTRLAVTDTIVGTPPYMAPEAEQGAVRKESDIYSLGVCFYELLAGRLPFGGYGAGMLLNKMNVTFKPLSAAVPGLPDGIDSLMARVLSPEPNRRIKSAAEFLRALESLAAVR